MLMKTQGFTRILIGSFLLAGWITVQAQDQSEVPGDNFSLEGALELFKKSSSPEEFEKSINDADSKVNNLDLNGDGYIDYIRVIDRNEGNVHAFIMQAVLSETQSQDVAVISLEKLNNGKAILQITGDEDVYGVETIIEPTREVRTYGGTTTSSVAVNVWAWPAVQYVYGPYYSGWISPWGWAYRPFWWHTWRPIAYYDYYPYWGYSRPYYSVCYSHRIFYAQNIYRPYRSTSVIFYNRHNREIANYRSTRGDYNGRNRYDRDRPGGRTNNTGSIRYDGNGRLASNTPQRGTSRSSDGLTRQGRTDNRSSYNKREGFSSTNRSVTEPRNGQQRSTGVERNPSSNGGSGTTNGRTATPQRETRPTVNSNRMETSGSSGVQRSNSPNVQRSLGSPSGGQQMQRSSAPSSNSQRSFGGSHGSTNVQRSSSSPSMQRSSSAPGVQRSLGGSSGSPSMQRSPSRSTGSPSMQRSPGGSSGRSSDGGSSGGSSGGQRRGRD